MFWFRYEFDSVLTTFETFLERIRIYFRAVSRNHNIESLTKNGDQNNAEWFVSTQFEYPTDIQVSEVVSAEPANQFKRIRF